MVRYLVLAVLLAGCASAFPFFQVGVDETPATFGFPKPTTQGVDPSQTPSTTVSVVPSETPVNNPTVAPTVLPSQPPVTNPTQPPVNNPTLPPATNPTVAPTIPPSQPPATNPTVAPTVAPTLPPATNPTVPPATNPTAPPATTTTAPSGTVVYPSNLPNSLPVEPSTTVLPETCADRLGFDKYYLDLVYKAINQANARPLVSHVWHCYRMVYVKNYEMHRLIPTLIDQCGQAAVDQVQALFNATYDKHNCAAVEPELMKIKEQQQQ